jgi:spoIIIJ-associated protein
VNKRTFSGRTLDEALEGAVREYRKSRDQLHYRVQEDKRTLLGLEKVVTIEVVEESVSPAVRQFLNRVILGVGLSLSYEIDVQEEMVCVDLTGNDLGLMLKNNGELLDAVQTLLARVLQKQGWEGGVEVDGDAFRQKLKDRVHRMAVELCQKARRDNRSVAVQPLPPHLRKVVHLAATKFPGVETKSQGSGYIKRVIITPKKG